MGAYGFPRPTFHGFAHFAEAAFEEVVGGFDDNQFLGFGQRVHKGFQFGFGGELVARAAHEEFWLGAALQEFVVVGAVVDRGDRRAQGDESAHARVGTGGAQADGGAEGESGEDQGEMEFVVEPVEGGADVVELARPVIVFALAESSAAEVEAQHGEAKVVQRFHGVEDNLVVEGASVDGMRMADDGGVGGVEGTGVQERFKLAGGAVEKE